MSPRRKGDPEKETRGTTGAAPEAAADEAAEAKEKAAAEAAAQEAEAAEPEPDADAEEEAAAEEQAADEETEKKPRRRRRGAAETTAGKKTPKRRSPDADVAVRARARYVRTAPRKARLVVDHIRGKSVPEARAILAHTPRGAARDVAKLLESAIANAENNMELIAEELKVGQVAVDEGPTIKRYRPRALGRATRINKRTSHLSIVLTAAEEN